MGQQQLLLLVLATVIVGLATVAGIQAFDEGQTQATQDALTQRALSIGSDIYAATQEPTQFGGTSLTGDASAGEVAASAGYGNTSDTDGNGIPADGAGDGATCDIAAQETATVVCTGPDGSQTVTVDVSESGGPSVASINGTDVGS